MIIDIILGLTVLRKAWCDHMASEIEREFNLKGG